MGSQFCQIEQTEDGKIAALKSSFHERQAARTNWGTKMEDRRVVDFRSVVHKKQVARMEYKKLESTASVRPSTLALHSATSVENQLDCVKNLPDDLRKHPSRLRKPYLGQQQELLQEMDALVTQYEKDHEDPMSQKRLLAKMQGLLITSKGIRDERINTAQVLTDTIKNKARQEEEMMQVDGDRIAAVRCVSHEHQAARMGSRDLEPYPIQKQNSLPGKDLSNPSHPFFEVWQK